MVFHWTNEFWNKIKKDIFYWTTYFFEQIKKNIFFYRMNGFIKQPIILHWTKDFTEWSFREKKNKIWWKINNNFENERNQFFERIKKNDQMKRKSLTCPSLVSNAYLQHSGSHLPSFPGILDKLYNSWTIHIKQFGFNSLLDLNGVPRQCMEFELNVVLWTKFLGFIWDI